MNGVKLPKIVTEPSAVIGIDPGKSGGIAVVVNTGEVRLHNMPATENDLWSLIHTTVDEFYPHVTAMIERVQGYIGGEGHPGKTMFVFGQGYGSLRMALVASDCRWGDVGPATWQKTVGIVPRKKDESKGQFKNRLKARAQQLYPKARGSITLGTADALLIAHYALTGTVK